MGCTAEAWGNGHCEYSTVPQFFGSDAVPGSAIVCIGYLVLDTAHPFDTALSAYLAHRRGMVARGK
jgi:hypothetical protein